ncbi:MAG: hypothetical protein ACOX3T_05035 [Bdellovibrionota bacterium]
MQKAIAPKCRQAPAPSLKKILDTVIGGDATSKAIERERVKTVLKVTALVSEALEKEKTIYIEDLFKDILNFLTNEDLAYLKESDDLIKDLEKSFLKLLTNDIKNNFAMDASKIAGFMFDKLSFPREFFKDEYVKTNMLSLAREIIKKSLKGEEVATGALYVVNFLQKCLSYNKEDIFPKNLRYEYNKYGIKALETSLKLGCIEEAQITISFMEEYLAFDKAELEEPYKNELLHNALLKGYREALSCEVWKGWVPKFNRKEYFRGFKSFGKDYLGLSENRITEELKEIEKEIFTK